MKNTEEIRKLQRMKIRIHIKQKSAQLCHIVFEKPNEMLKGDMLFNILLRSPCALWVEGGGYTCALCITPVIKSVVCSVLT